MESTESKTHSVKQEFFNAIGGERSFAEVCLNREDAPISVISGTPIGRPKSTSSEHLADQSKLLD
jgi:hypothetical protein